MTYLTPSNREIKRTPTPVETNRILNTLYSEPLTEHEWQCQRRWQLFSTVREIAWRKPTAANSNAANEALARFVFAFVNEPPEPPQTDAVGMPPDEAA